MATDGVNVYCRGMSNGNIQSFNASTGVATTGWNDDVRLDRQHPRHWPSIAADLWVSDHGGERGQAL